MYGKKMLLNFSAITKKNNEGVFYLIVLLAGGDRNAAKNPTVQCPW